MVSSTLTAITKRLTEGERPLLLSWEAGRFPARKRELYVTPSVNAELGRYVMELSSGRSGRGGARWRALPALLWRWILGQTIAFEAELKALDPWQDGIWAFRAHYPRPGVRLLGFLADPNVFVAVGLYDRDSLGSGSSSKWHAATRAALNEWGRLYDDEVPMCCPDSLRDEIGLRSFWNDGQA